MAEKSTSCSLMKALLPLIKLSPAGLGKRATISSPTAWRLARSRRSCTERRKGARHARESTPPEKTHAVIFSYSARGLLQGVAPLRHSASRQNRCRCWRGPRWVAHRSASFGEGPHGRHSLLTSQSDRRDAGAVGGVGSPASGPDLVAPAIPTHQAAGSRQPRTQKARQPVSRCDTQASTDRTPSGKRGQYEC